jgi:hypothetical protein
MVSQTSTEHFTHYGFLRGPDGGESGHLFAVALGKGGAVALKGVDGFTGAPTDEMIAAAIPGDGVVEVDIYSPSVDVPAINSIVNLAHPPTKESAKPDVRLVCGDEALAPHVDLIAEAGHFATGQAFQEAA